MKKASLTILAICMGSFSAVAQEVPAQLQAAMLMKLLKFYNNIENKEFSIYFYGETDIFDLVQKQIGTSIGNAKLVKVEKGNDLPDEKFDVVYVARDPAKASEYCIKFKSLSMTGKTELTAQNISLGVAVKDNKPKVLLNLSQSKEEGVSWAPTILKMAVKMQ